VRQPADVEEVRKFLKEKNSPMEIIAKIETRESIHCLEDIVKVSDGIMVARGDLGAEIPFEDVPVIQDTLVALSRKWSKPVIVATHMLESMIEQPMPTRAEVTDIAHAATTKTDATMLSGETANGKFPVGAVEAMQRVLMATEAHVTVLKKPDDIVVETPREARASAAVQLAGETGASAIIVLTHSGKTARDVCKYRPSQPILAFTEDAGIQQRLQLSFGVLPFLLTFSAEPEQTVQAAIAMAQKAGLCTSGDKVVIVADIKASDHLVHAIQIRDIA